MTRHHCLLLSLLFLHLVARQNNLKYDRHFSQVFNPIYFLANNQAVSPFDIHPHSQLRIRPAFPLYPQLSNHIQCLPNNPNACQLQSLLSNQESFQPLSRRDNLVGALHDSPVVNLETNLLDNRCVDPLDSQVCSQLDSQPTPRRIQPEPFLRHLFQRRLIRQD